MPLLPRPEIQGLGACPHGSINYVELETLGIAPEDVLDFSANLNPFGPLPEVITTLCNSQHTLNKAISHYPDSEASCLRQSLAEKLGIKAENILVGSGSTELIRLTALAYFAKGDQVLIIEPTYSEYRTACQIVGASLIQQQLSPQNGFWLDIDETIELIRQHHPRGIFICNPNNPTGRYLSRETFSKILDTCRDSLVVLDEAYVNFVNSAWPSMDLALQAEESNLLILRSMTKDYAIAGLRLGYGIARKDIIATLRRICPPWNVNAIAQKAGILAIAEEEYLRRCQSELNKAKSYLMTELSGLGLSVFPSEANFFLVEVGDATTFRSKLLEQRILVRDCSSFNLPQYIRIAPRTVPECQRLVAAVKETLITLSQHPEHRSKTKQVQVK